jgi:hypothetical protein
MTVQESVAKIWVLRSIISYGSVIHRDGVSDWLKVCHFNTPKCPHVPDTSNPPETPDHVSEVSDMSSQKTLIISKK